MRLRFVGNQLRNAVEAPGANRLKRPQVGCLTSQRPIVAGQPWDFADEDRGCQPVGEHEKHHVA